MRQSAGGCRPLRGHWAGCIEFSDRTGLRSYRARFINTLYCVFFFSVCENFVEKLVEIVLFLKIV